MGAIPRRRLLAVTGTALTGAVAGCTGSDDSGNGNGDGSTDGDDSTGNDGTDADEGAGGTLLGNVVVENLDDTSHSVDVIVEFDGEPEHWSTHGLEGGEGVDLERDWSTEPGAFRVLVRLDGGDPTRITPERWNGPNCVNVFVLIGREGGLTISGDTGGGPCGEGEATVDEAETGSGS
ncbi:hypothetical protein A6E15_16405 [Natrinema saccharevitans]|uniref:Uncharacterized protein n=1 Tax=Natrinema saccharevitans TaxID=301967 RepID=A0A1S8B0S0_9EURY|nr:hypothetical protein [Natrinema saccharevitans]OLZ42446.1 hypothetical protein A6E15_16405 [Natrinema saccharevitans]